MQAQGFWFWMEGVMNLFFWAGLYGGGEAETETPSDHHAQDNIRRRLPPSTLLTLQTWS